jgi:hypothetical protein
MLTGTPFLGLLKMTRYDLSSSSYGLPLYTSLDDAAAMGFHRLDENSDGVLLRKPAAKGWEYAVVLHAHLQGTYR